jgi:hypothetical protein
MIGERLLAEEDDDPVLSLVNLIDVFLVLIAALLLAMGSHPLNPFSADKVTVIRNAGRADMQVVIKDGRRVERFKAAEGAAGGGSGGVKAGVAYRMADGSLVYVPE